jgi:hypothetical protein
MIDEVLGFELKKGISVPGDMINNDLIIAVNDKQTACIVLSDGRMQLAYRQNHRQYWVYDTDNDLSRFEAD